MIETLMKQLYFRDLRRRIEYLESQRREQIPAQAYLYWIDGGDGNDPLDGHRPERRRMVPRRPRPHPRNRDFRRESGVKPK